MPPRKSYIDTPLRDFQEEKINIATHLELLSTVRRRKSLTTDI